MGQKYVPSIKDLKANARHAGKQLNQSKFIKPAAPRTAPKKKK